MTEIALGSLGKCRTERTLASHLYPKLVDLRPTVANIKRGEEVVYSHVIFEPVEVKSRWTGELEESRKPLIDKFIKALVPVVLATKLTIANATRILANNATQVDAIRDGFSQILDVFTAIAEPILWFYALTACIMIATKNKDAGWARLKQVGYAYAGIALLPTFFALLRFIAEMIKGAITL